jgi:hypothetical protein
LGERGLGLLAVRVSKLLDHPPQTLAVALGDRLI